MKHDAFSEEVEQTDREIQEGELEPEKSDDPSFDAIQKLDLRVVKDVLLDGSVNRRNKDGQTYLMVLMQTQWIPYHHDVIRLLLESGADVKAQDACGRTVLHHACRRPRYMNWYPQDLQIVNTLLEKGADINARENDGLTPLMELMRTGVSQSNWPLLELLLDAGSDVTSRDNDGRTALHHAAEPGRRGAIRSIVERGGDINAVDREGRTPLMFLVASPDYSVEFDIADVLKMGADLTIETPDGYTVWDFICRPTSLWPLLHKIDVHYQDSHGETALMKVCRLKQPQFAAKLIEKGADISVRNKAGKTAFMLACEPCELPWQFAGQKELLELFKNGGGYEEQFAQPVLNGMRLVEAVEAQDASTVRNLLAMGVSTAVTNGRGLTPLMIASENGHEEIVELLIEAGADVNAESASVNTTALVEASGKGHVSIVRRLLVAGADATKSVGYSQFQRKRTALIDASANGRIEVVKVLLAAGADANFLGEERGEFGSSFSALTEAIRNGHIQIAHILVEAGADTNLCDPLQKAAAKGDLKMLQYLLERGASAEASLSLETAAWNGVVEMVQLLLEQGADIDRGNSLALAAANGGMQTVRLLVEKGADVNQPGDHSPFRSISYPLLEAIESGRQDIVAYLLDRGADVNVNDNGRTPLRDAFRSGHAGIVELLNRVGANTNPAAGLASDS